MMEDKAKNSRYDFFMASLLIGIVYIGVLGIIIYGLICLPF